MVKVGFIVEGDSEKIVVESLKFRNFLEINGFSLIQVISKDGGKKLQPQHTKIDVKSLKDEGVEAIFVLTDSEDDTPEEVRKSIECEEISYIFIAVKALEAWYLADTVAMRNFLENNEFMEEFPEKTEGKPLKRLLDIARKLKARGPGPSKSRLAFKMVNYWGFSIENAASHQNCPSAKEMVAYFAKSLKST